MLILINCSPTQCQFQVNLNFQNGMFLSEGITICTTYDNLCPLMFESDEETLGKKLNRNNISFKHNISQVGHTYRCCLHRGDSNRGTIETEFEVKIQVHKV